MVKFKRAPTHKVRAARHIVREGIASGKIVPGKTTVIEKTGGNFGFGLVVACQEYGIPVELAVGLSFSPIKRRCLEFFGAELIGLDMLEKGAKPREVIDWCLANQSSLGKEYFFTDQFNNPCSLEAHFSETGPEIAAQLAEHYPELEALTFVSCGGTGASLTGIARALKDAGYAVNVVLVEPQGCDSMRGVFVDHPFEGMSVGVAPPFLDWSLINEVEYIEFSQAVDTQRLLSTRTGYFVGNTSAACLQVALRRSFSVNPHHKILTMIYDHGLWYAKGVFDAAKVRPTEI